MQGYYLKATFLIILIQGFNQACDFIETPRAKKISGTSSSSFSHSSDLAKCEICHSNDRPKPPHPSGGDCVSCHNYPDWKQQKVGIGQLVHDPMPSSCNSCHEAARPAFLTLQVETV